jgi:hypothetical protein
VSALDFGALGNRNTHNQLFLRSRCVDEIFTQPCAYFVHISDIFFMFRRNCLAFRAEAGNSRLIPPRRASSLSILCRSMLSS